MQNKEELKKELEQIVNDFDECLSSFQTEYVEDENEDGKCLLEVNALDDLNYSLLTKTFYKLMNLVDKL